MKRITVRQGYMLVEMLVAIGVGMVLMGVSTALIHTTFDTERSLRGQLVGRQSLDRLAEPFRRDVHAAEQVAIGAEPVQCTLTGVGQPSVVYRMEQGQVVREVREEETLVTSVAFPLPRNCKVEFNRQEEAGHSLVGFTLTPEPVEDLLRERMPCRICVTALLGRDAMATAMLVSQGESPELPGEKP